MRAILFESISVNGLIARPNGDSDFFSRYCWTGAIELGRQAGGWIWGRTTHDMVRGWEGALDDLDGVPRVVLTGNPDYVVDEGWMTAATPQGALDALEQVGCDAALVVGGQAVNTAFATAGLLDEVILFVESVAVGRGLPLFSGEDFPDLRLRLLEVTRPTDTLLHLHYRVLGRSE